MHQRQPASSFMNACVRSFLIIWVILSSTSAGMLEESTHGQARFRFHFDSVLARTEVNCSESSAKERQIERWSTSGILNDLGQYRYKHTRSFNYCDRIPL